MHFSVVFVKCLFEILEYMKIAATQQCPRNLNIIAYLKRAVVLTS